MYGLLAGIAGILLGMFLGVSSYSVGPLTAYLVSPAYRTIPALLLLVIVMYVRPQGLFGRR